MDILLLFTELYSEIDKIHNSTIENKWETLSTLISSKNELFKKIFELVKSNPDKKIIKLNYEYSLDTLKVLISENPPDIFKIYYIIIYLHHIVYQYSSLEGNYYNCLDGQKEMIILHRESKYFINLSLKDQKNSQFHAFLLTYCIESLFNKHLYVGIDFEQTNHKIIFHQLNFEHSNSNKGIVWMVSPLGLDDYILDDMIYFMFCNRYIYKILHGSDAQDIPYIYKELLKNDKKKIIKFMRRYIDTRWLCEYYKLSRSEVSDTKCSIYNYEPENTSILYFNVISAEKQKDLANLLESLPPPQDREWNFRAINKSQLSYAIYDVLFLKYLYYGILNKAMLEFSSDMEKKIIVNFYKKYLLQFVRLCTLHSQEIITIINKCKEEVDPINNYMIKTPAPIKLIDIFNKEKDNLVINTKKINIDKIYKVSYLKKPLQIIIKKIIYTILSQKNTIYKDKVTLWNGKLDNKYLYDYLELLELRDLKTMFQEIETLLIYKLNFIKKY